MRKLAIALGVMSFAALTGTVVINAPASAEQQTVDCVKVMNALKGPDMTPQITAMLMKVPVDEIVQCQNSAARQWGSGPIPDQLAHPVIGPGGNYADPGDYATRFKQTAW